MKATTNDPSSGGPSEDGGAITFLVEVVKATLPQSGKRRGRDDDDGGGRKRGAHVTATWVGPTNPSGRRRRSQVVHRTETVKIKYRSSGELGSPDNAADGELSDGADGCAEHVFTVDDGSLFLFETSMRQLVNASARRRRQVDANGKGKRNEEADDDDAAGGRYQSGGLRFDIFEKPLDVLSSVYSTVLADNVSEKEANATTRETPSSYASYRLIGSVFLTPEEILEKCDERRLDCPLVENWRVIHRQQPNSSSAGSMAKEKVVDGAELALRIRPASEFDVDFMRNLSECGEANGSSGGSGAVNAALQSTLIRSTTGSPNLEPAKLITEVDENVLAAESSMKALGNISPIAQESMRRLFSSGGVDAEKRLLVKPFPDPARPEETKWFTEERLQRECYGPSTNWIQAGQRCSGSGGSGSGSGSLGQVYLEVLECRGLPNTDAGETITGNKTDAFVSVVYENVLCQTEVIDDSLSPMWMPWTSRAFVFELGHPSSALYVGVADYDVGPMEHECIGRVAVQLGSLVPSTVYTLTYNLYESSNLTERGDDVGTITLRLRIEVSDEKRHLMMGRRAPERKWLSSQQWKSHRVAKFCVDGPHDEEVFEMRLFRSHINELLTQKRYASYAISDAIKSLVYWRGQVKVGQVWLPVHSAVVFYFSVHVVENPRLLPSFLFFGLAWVMIANMFQRTNHPDVWQRGHSFLHFWNVLTHGESHISKVGARIDSMEAHKEAARHEAAWKQRIADDDARYARQLELDAKIKTISDDAIIRTKTKASANAALVDPISAVAGAKLLPYQQRLAGYCATVRYVRNVMNWSEPIIAFFATLTLFGAGLVALFVPWGFLLQWSSRLVVWIFLGPWMRLIDLFFQEEAERQKDKLSKKAIKAFHEQQKVAKIVRENALKMKAFRVKLFGSFITRLPELNLTRHQDVPLPESSCEPYYAEKEVRAVKFVPAQDLSGCMIPMTGQDAAESQLRKRREQERLFGLYQNMVDDTTQSTEPVPEEDDLDESFELVGTEDRVVCLHSESSDVGTHELTMTTQENLSVRRNSSDRDIVVSDKAIQLALGNQLLPHGIERSPTSKWVFSASIQLSLRKEAIKEEDQTTALCDEASNLIEDADAVAEEGVEIVPFLSSDACIANDSHVSVYYDEVKANSTRTMHEIGGDERQNDTTSKKVTFNEDMCTEMSDDTAREE